MRILDPGREIPICVGQGGGGRRPSWGHRRSYGLWGQWSCRLWRWRSCGLLGLRSCGLWCHTGHDLLGILEESWFMGIIAKSFCWSIRYPNDHQTFIHIPSLMADYPLFIILLQPGKHMPDFPEPICTLWLVFNHYDNPQGYYRGLGCRTWYRYPPHAGFLIYVQQHNT